MKKTDRRQGIEFDEFGEVMSSLEYPVNTNELLAKHGESKLELSNETITLSTGLEPLQDENQTYRNEAELETMIMNMVGDTAIGRKNYSDRDSTAIGEERDVEGAPGQEVDDDGSF